MIYLYAIYSHGILVYVGVSDSPARRLQEHRRRTLKGIDGLSIRTLKTYDDSFEGRRQGKAAETKIIIAAKAHGLCRFCGGVISATLDWQPPTPYGKWLRSEHSRLNSL